MKFKKGLASLLAAVTLLGQVMVGEPMQVKAAQNPQTVTVDVSTTYQNIRGFGGMNHTEWTEDLTVSQRKTAFGNGTNELGLSVLRINVSQDSSKWSSVLATAKYASDMGATVFASPWEAPKSLMESGGSKGLYHLPSKNYGAYAEHLNNFGKYMKQNGVNLYAISVQSEPDYASNWLYWSSDEMTDFIANYGDKITSTKLMSPESFQYAPSTERSGKDGGKNLYTKILNNAKAKANIDVFATHFYGTRRDWMDFPELEKSGKEIWMTEVYLPNNDANSGNRWPEALLVAENIHNALVVGNMSVYTWWYIRRSYGLIDESGNITKCGYCMAQYSKFIRPGYKRIAATEQPASNVYVSAYKGNGNKVVIVAVNNGETEYSQKFSLGEYEMVNVDRYRTSSNENLALTKNLSLSNGGTAFLATLPSKSVSTFVVTLSGDIVKNGLHQDKDGVWRYYKNSTLQKVTGLVYDENIGWWYVQNGAINFGYNGLVEHNGAWWCVAGGRVAFEYTGLWSDANVGWWYVENGAINFSYNGFVGYDGAWWCVAGGRVVFEYTGLWSDANVGWWYVENGAINFSYNGLVFYNDTWWCVAGGQVAFEYTGLWSDPVVGWWFVQNGAINFAYTGQAQNEYGIWNVVNGQVIFG